MLYDSCCFQTCARVLLPAEERRSFQDTLRNPNLGYLQKKGLRKKIVERCRKINTCPYCGAFNGKDHISIVCDADVFFYKWHYYVVHVCVCTIGVVKKCGLLKIVHDCYKQGKKQVDSRVATFIQSFNEAIEKNDELESLLAKVQVKWRVHLSAIRKIIWFF